jgi:uncharacterized protein YodC (DUF2158 family)
MSTFAKRISIATAITFGIAISVPSSASALSETAQSKAAMRSRTVASFQPGDLVRLRSGGPLMTVDSIIGNEADCYWTRFDGRPNAESFPIDVLQKF